MFFSGVIYSFKPAKGYVIVEVKKISETTESGIIKAPSQIEEEKKKLDSFLTVLASNPSSEYQIGDKILIQANKYPAVVLDDVECFIVSEIFIYGKK